MSNAINICKVEVKQDESRLIERILNGESYLVEDLFSPYERRAKAIARRFLSGDESRIEDVIQEATMKAFLNLKKLRNDARFGSWFLTIVRNLAVDAVKRENVYVDQPGNDSNWDFESWASKLESVKPEPTDRICTSEMAERVKRELAVIDANYRDPIRMRYFDDLTYDEIASILGKPLGTVKSLIHRGKEILRDRMYAHAV